MFKGIPIGFLSGNYELVAFLKGNRDKYQTTFEVIPGQMTQIDIIIDYQPPPPFLEPPIATGSLAISNLFESININLSKIENDDEIIAKVKASVLNGELKFDYKDRSIGYKRNKSELLLTNLQLGTYLLGAYTISNETFPGKYYTLLYSFEDTVWIDKGGGHSKITLPDKKRTSSREIVIYLNPFPQTKDEEYKLFLDNSKTPFSVVTNVGEIHIAGVAYDFSGNMIIKRDGYKSSSLSIEPGKEKLYLHADLSQSNNPQIKNKIPKPPPWKKRPKPKDCAGVVGGSAVVDECGVCDGDGASCIEDEKRVPEKRKESFRKPPSNKIEKKFEGFWGFPGGTLNGNANISKNKYNLSALVSSSYYYKIRIEDYYNSLIYDDSYYFTIY